MNTNDTHPFETNLDRHPSNYIPLSPVSFLTRAASAFADKVAVIDGARRYTYAQLFDRCVRLASALSQLGIKGLDTVAIIASNIPEMIEAHFAVPMLGAVLNPLNTRLDAANVAFSLGHGSAKVLIVDAEYAPLVRQALQHVDQEICGLIADHRLTHHGRALPVVNRLAPGPADQRVQFQHTVTIATGGAAPPSAVFRSMEALGFRVTHLYGATEPYGPATSCVFQPKWNTLPDDERFARMARQGVAYPMVEAAELAVAH